jgi:hypothetical protein
MNERRELWTRLHGQIPKGFLVLVLNGQPNDLRPENLACVPRDTKNARVLTAPFEARIRELENRLKSVNKE